YLVNSAHRIHLSAILLHTCWLFGSPENFAMCLHSIACCLNPSEEPSPNLPCKGRRTAETRWRQERSPGTSVVVPLSTLHHADITPDSAGGQELCGLSHKAVFET